MIDTEAQDTPTEAEEPWNMFAWRFSIPLCDDLWLGMQAQNIAVVDRLVRHFEQNALEEFYEHDRFSMDSLVPLSAMSQVWVFALYEFLRTWLQRAGRLIRYSERLAALKTDEERAAYLKEVEADAQEKAKHIKLAPVFYYDHVAKIGDEKFIQSIRNYRETIKGLFRDVEAIRVPLAKHEIAGTKAKGFMAEAPGYGRVDLATGSMYWQIVLTDGMVDVIKRHALADAFFGTKPQREKSALFASDEAHAEAEPTVDFFEPDPPRKKRRRRRGRRGGVKRKRSSATKTPIKTAAKPKRKPGESEGGW